MKEEAESKGVGDVPSSNHEIPMPTDVKIPKTEVATIEETNKFRLRTVVSDQDIIDLRATSEPVTLAHGDNSGKPTLTKDTVELIAALKAYILEHDGLGMAAIQLGVAERVFVMRKPFSSDNLLTVINPTIIRGRGKSTKAEGCFSIPDLPDNIKGARVQRMSTIFVNYTDDQCIEQKEEMMVGMDARIFQHEFSHLDGALILDDQTKYGKFMGWERLF